MYPPNKIYIHSTEQKEEVLLSAPFPLRECARRMPESWKTWSRNALEASGFEEVVDGWTPRESVSPLAKAPLDVKEYGFEAPWGSEYGDSGVTGSWKSLCEAAALTVPLLAAFEEQFEAIRDEVMPLMERNTPSTPFYNDVEGLVRAGTWRQLPLARPESNGTLNLLPTLRKFLDQHWKPLAKHLPDAAQLSAMRQQTHVRPHVASGSHRWRVHLPLSTGLAGRMRVAGRTVSWEQGKPFIFDDSFEHEVHIEPPSNAHWLVPSQDGNHIPVAISPSSSPAQERVIILLDIWHPLLANDPDNQNRIIDTWQ